MGTREASPRFLNARFGFLQVAVWAGNCAIAGFATVYLLQHGFSYTLTGVLIACANLITVVLQPLMGSFADRTTRFTLKQIVCAAALLGVLAAVGLELNAAFMNSFAVVAVLYAASTVLYVTVQPLVNAMGLKQGDAVNFGFARGLGSLAYALTAALVGFAVASIGPTLVDDAMIVCWTLVLVGALSFPRTPASQKPAVSNSEISSNEQPSSLLHFFRKYRLLCLVVCGYFFLLFSHTGMNVFLITIMEEAGGDSSSFGLATAIAAIVEFPAMSAYVLLRKRFRCESILMFAAGMFFVKTIATMMAPSVPVLLGVQLLQAGAFALYVPAIVDYANSTTSSTDSVKGQAILLASQTLSLALASLMGGMVLEAVGLGANKVIWMLTSAAGVAIVLFLLRPRRGAERPCTSPSSQDA